MKTIMDKMHEIHGKTCGMLDRDEWFHATVCLRKRMENHVLEDRAEELGLGHPFVFCTLDDGCDFGKVEDGVDCGCFVERGMGGVSDPDRYDRLEKSLYEKISASLSDDDVRKRYLEARDSYVGKELERLGKERSKVLEIASEKVEISSKTTEKESK